MCKYYSNEIVFRGHPDKVCDQISAALLKEYVAQDKNTRAGIEVVGGKGKIFVTGEVTSSGIVNIEEVTKRVLRSVGYSDDYEIIDNLGLQSPDISQGVDNGGAGDNGMMFGYACNDTPELLPTAMVILQRFAEWYDKLRLQEKDLLPDGKVQITGEYDDDFKLVKIKAFTICYQNLEVNRDYSDKLLIDLASEICADYDIKAEKFLINPTGKFLVGGFEGDAGVCGRKIVVDAYQSFANVGGGCQNGKDSSKVDFSATHKARQIAKKYLVDYSLKWCEVQLSYSIGIAEPMAIYITSDIGELQATKELYEECKPNNIIKDLKLKEINYEELAKFGHFRD